MNKKRFCALAFILMIVLLCTACTLAQPEVESETGTEDRYVGIYVVSEEDSWAVNGEVIGQYSEEEETYIFPGLEGYALFVARKGQGDDSYMASYVDMGDVNIAYHSVETETEQYTDCEISGTLYVTREDTYWRLFNVYQKPDGTIYLNGTGNCYGGCSIMTTEEKATKTLNGQSINMGTTKVSVTIETVQIAQSTGIYWYGSDGELLLKESVDPVNITELSWHSDASWLVLEETFEEDVSQTLYEKRTEEEPTTLKIMTLGENGMGEMKEIPVK